MNRPFDLENFLGLCPLTLNLLACNWASQEQTRNEKEATRNCLHGTAIVAAVVKVKEWAK